MEKDSEYWATRTRRDRVTWIVLGWLYIPLLIALIFFPSSYHDFVSSASTLARFLCQSVALMLYSICPACFIWPHDSSSLARRKFLYGVFALLYLFGNLLGVRGSVWYAYHVELIAILVFARMALATEVERGEYKEVPNTQWFDKAVAGMLIGGMLFHFHWYTWRWVDAAVGLMLGVLALVPPVSYKRANAFEPI